MKYSQWLEHLREHHSYFTLYEDREVYKSTMKSILMNLWHTHPEIFDANAKISTDIENILPLIQEKIPSNVNPYRFVAGMVSWYNRDLCNDFTFVAPSDEKPEYKPKI